MAWLHARRWFITRISSLLGGGLALCILFWAGVCHGQATAISEALESIKRQNALLQQQLQQQQERISELTHKVAELEKDRSTPEAAQSAHSSGRNDTPEPNPKGAFGFGKVNISGEGGAALFHSGSRGKFPNAEFRVDEAKIFVEAPVCNDVYFFAEINAVTREDKDEFFRIGELYVDFENLSRFFNQPRWVNLRVGRFDIPFGEEYLTRDAIDNPLISHSLSDLWGVDEGLMLFGKVGRFDYNLALQNGGHPALRDYHIDKSVALRVKTDPAPWLGVSVSAMRTGALDLGGDELSELWFGNGFFRGLGASGTTSRFEADLLAADVRFRWRGGYLHGAGGYVAYDDDDTAADNDREVFYYYVEGVQHLTKKFYLASRWSQIFAPGGFPIVGNGDFGDYLFGRLTSDLSRFTVGAGYRFSRQLLLKTDFSFDTGRERGGRKRNHENLFAAEIAFAF